MDDLPPRQPTWAEMLPLDKAVASSNETVNATLELFHESEFIKTDFDKW